MLTPEISTAAAKNLQNGSDISEICNSVETKNNNSGTASNHILELKSEPVKTTSELHSAVLHKWFCPFDARSAHHHIYETAETNLHKQHFESKKCRSANKTLGD